MPGPFVRPRRLRRDRECSCHGIESRKLMRRVPSTPRNHWEAMVEAAGLTWHSGEPAVQTQSKPPKSETYWNESALYELTPREVDVLESSTDELAGMTLRGAQHVIENKLYSKMGGVLI